jgi:FAD/FMN-containing dehydrogenase
VTDDVQAHDVATPERMRAELSGALRAELSRALRAELSRALRAVVGDAHVLEAADTRAGYERDWTGRFGGPALAVVRPADTAEVAGVLRACAAAGVAVIPQGGNTGLVGGSVPAATGPAPVIVSTSRLTAVGPVDGASGQVTAGAGVSLATLQAAAAAAGMAFAVDLAARDSATVGGMVATNAGGLHVVRYGTMRAQVLGVEAVLADGTVVSRLSGLLKDNTGYDLSQLLVGSEGTLAVVTAARLRLVPALPEHVTALIGLDGTASALDVVAAVRAGTEGLEAAEVFYRNGLELVMAHAGLPDPLPRPWPAYLVVECASRRDPTDGLYEVLVGLDLDADATAVATDGPGRARLWAYRERHTEAVNALGIPHKLDVTVPLSALADLEARGRAVVEQVAPGSTSVIFGHVGDGNLHLNVVGPPPEDEAVDEAVLRLVASLGGSISAEHGIGRAKAAWLHLSRSPAEQATMRALKAALDPAWTLNPGVILTA